MTNKELKKLSRRQLLELMVAQSQRIDALEAELAEARRQLEDRRIAAQEAGSIAEAALRVNRVFEAAQAAADQYLASIRGMERRDG